MAKKQKSPEKKKRRRTYSKVRHSLRLVKRLVKRSESSVNYSLKNHQVTVYFGFCDQPT